MKNPSRAWNGISKRKDDDAGRFVDLDLYRGIARSIKPWRDARLLATLAPSLFHVERATFENKEVKKKTRGKEERSIRCINVIPSELIGYIKVLHRDISIYHQFQV